MNLQEFFRTYRRVALGFSGGVDSAYLLYAGQRYGADIRPYYIKTAFQPSFELEDALRLGDQLGVSVCVLDFDVLREGEVTINQEDRCYHCKKALFGLLCKQASFDGYAVIIDGTNASDDAKGRPGMRALIELSVRSPLREAGLTKEKIRLLSKEAGLFTWNKPAYACLATRIPENRRITREVLACVEGAENALLSLGFLDFRVRVFGDAARVQVKEAHLPMALEKREEILRLLKPYFNVVLLDMEAR